MKYVVGALIGLVGIVLLIVPGGFVLGSIAIAVYTKQLKARDAAKELNK